MSTNNELIAPRSRTLLDLPVELLGTIADALDSRSLAYFARTCSELHAAVTPCLYHSIGWDGLREGFSSSSTWEVQSSSDLNLTEPPHHKPYLRTIPKPTIDALLRSVLATPRIGENIRELSFTVSDAAQNSSYNRGPLSFLHRRPPTEALDTYKAMIRAANTPDTDSWIARVDQGCTLVAILLIILQTRNLRRLRIHANYDATRPFTSTLAHLVSASSLLLRLQHLHIPGDICMPISHAEKFFQLPQLRCLEITIRSERSFLWSGLTPLSCTNLTSLSLQVQHREPGMLANIFSAAPNLKHFQYSFFALIDGPLQFREDERIFFLDCDDLGQALQCVASSLRSLKIRVWFTSEEEAPMYEDSSELWGVGTKFGSSLHSLSHLEEVTIPFLGIVEEDDLSAPDAGTLFPRSIRNLRFTLDAFWSSSNEDRDQDALEEWIVEFLTNCRESLPLLESVMLPLQTEEGQEMIAELELPEGFVKFHDEDY